MKLDELQPGQALQTLVGARGSRSGQGIKIGETEPLQHRRAGSGIGTNVTSLERFHGSIPHLAEAGRLSPGRRGL